MDPLAEQLAEELRAAAGRRQRLLAVECDDALLEVAPQLQSDPNRRQRLLELLTELERVNAIAWSVGRDRSVRPELPAFITLTDKPDDEPQATTLPRVSWRPELEWAYTLRLTPREHEILSVIQTYRRDRDRDTMPIPHRERSLLLFGDEKRLDRLLRSRLFLPGHLSLDLLDAYWAAPPLAFADTGGTGPVVVSENAASWHTLVTVLRGRARAVAYGAGGAFAQGVAWLASIADLHTVLYIGDLDPGDGPKYDNPAGSLGSNPRLAWARTVRPPKPGLLVICEGIPDALTAAQEGFRSTAILGSQAPDHSVATRLASFAERHQLSLLGVVDNDSAGLVWGERLAGLLRDAGQDLQVAVPPNAGTDLNSWASLDPEWYSRIDGPVQVEQLPAVEHDLKSVSGIGVQ